MRIPIPRQGLRERLRAALCALLAASVLGAGPAAGGENKLYKWIDEDGNVIYQDQPPPEGAGQVQTFASPADDPAPGGPTPAVDVVLYAIEDCDACDLVRKVLDDRGVPFEEKDAENNVEVQSEIREVAGTLSVPVLVIGDGVLTGYNKQVLGDELDEAGFTASGTAGAARRDRPGQAAGGDRPDQPSGDDPSEVDPSEEDDFFSDFENDSGDGDNLTELEPIPEDERIRVTQ